VPGNISDVVSPDDLSAYAGIAGVLRYLTEPVSSPPPPSAASSVAPGVMAAAYSNYYAAGIASGMEHVPSVMRSSWLAMILGAVGDIAAFLAQLFALLLSPFFAAALQFLDGVRKGIDPTVGAIAVQVLNEFLGTDFTQPNLPLGLGTGDHLARANAIGGIMMGQLVNEFSPAAGAAVGPSMAPAQTFTGLAINFGIASAIMGIIGGMIPETHLDELRELGELVAENIGLGRLVRRALQPLIQILVANPMQWAINQQYTPTQFTIAELINPYAQTSVDQTHLFQAMNLLGYSNDKIQAIIEMHQKRFTPTDVKVFLDNGVWDEPTSEAYVTKLNWPAEIVPTVMLLEELRVERAWHDKLVAELEAEAKNGAITQEEFEAVIDLLPYSAGVKGIIKGTTAYKIKAHVGKTKAAHLSYAQQKQAFEAGLVTLSDLEDRWTAQGYSADDVNTLGLLLLLDLQKVEAAAAAKAAKAAAKTTAATSSSPASGLVSGTGPAGSAPAAPTGTTTP
jgi:hypothetical protein